MKRVLVANLVCSIALCGLHPVQAADLCTGIKLALGSAEDHFRSLRGKFDFTIHGYKSKVTFGYLSVCRVSGDSAMAEIECSVGIAQEQSVDAVWRKAVYDTKLCLGSDIEEQEGGLPNFADFNYLPTGDDIEIVKQYLDPPGIYIVGMTITTIDPTK